MQKYFYKFGMNFRKNVCRKICKPKDLRAAVLLMSQSQNLKSGSVKKKSIMPHRQNFKSDSVREKKIHFTSPATVSIAAATVVATALLTAHV